MLSTQNRNYEKYSQPTQKNINNPIIKPNFTVGGVLRASTYNNLKYECSLFRLTRENYANFLDNTKVDLLLVESISEKKLEHWGNSIFALISKFKEKGVCSTFWDTDANSFYKNIELIKLFDYIFTTNPNSIDEYKKALNNNNVFYLPLAVQPTKNNPIEKNITNKEDYILRKPQIEINRIISSHNKIYSILNKTAPNGAFTSIPREIFALLAIGTTLISPYSDALNDIFPEIINLYKSDEEKNKILSALSKDNADIDKLSMLCQRNVLTSHTYTNRFETILQKTQVMKMPVKLPGVAMVTSTNRVDSMENVFRNYQNQSYPNKQLIVVLNNNKMDLGEWKDKAQEYDNVKVFQIDEDKPLGRCLNHAIYNSDFPYFSKCDDDNYYARDFISDLMNTYKYATAEIVGKLTYYCYLEGCRTLALMCPNMEHRYVNMLSGSALIIKREVFEKVLFRDKPFGSDSVFLRECISQGIKMYSADRFNYVYKRHALQSNHTWKMKDEVFLKSCKLVDITDDYAERVTI